MVTPTAAPRGHVKVPTWAVTTEMLGAWGFPIEVREHIVGCEFVATKGMRFGAALEAAHKAGFTELAIMPTAVWEAEQARRAAIEAPKVCPEFFAWAMSVRAESTFTPGMT